MAYWAIQAVARSGRLYYWLTAFPCHPQLYRRMHKKGADQEARTRRTKRKA